MFSARLAGRYSERTGQMSHVRAPEQASAVWLPLPQGLRGLGAWQGACPRCCAACMKPVQTSYALCALTHPLVECI